MENMMTGGQAPSPAYDFRVYDQVWQRVAPGTDPFSPDPAAAGMTAVPQAVRPIPPVNPAPPVPAPVPRQEGGGEGNLPGAETNPCCMGTEAEGARLENMEGAALFAACAALGVRCCEIRAVANYVGDPFEQWDIPCAVTNLTETLRDLFADAE